MKTDLLILQIILYVILSYMYWCARCIYLMGKNKYHFLPINAQIKSEKQIHRRCWLEVLIWPICALYFLIIWLAKLPFKCFTSIKTYCVWLFTE